LGSLKEVFEALDRLSEGDKAYFMGYFGIHPDRERFSEKVKRWLEEVEE